MSSDRIRLLLPVRPENDCSHIARLLESLFGHEAVSILRLFVYRPAELDFYSAEMLAAAPAIRRLDAEEVTAASRSARTHCNALVSSGFDVESALIAGFPVDVVLEEAREWGADLIAVHALHDMSHETRVGQLAGALIDGSPVPVLIYPHDAHTSVRRVAVHVDLDAETANAVEWGLALAQRTGGSVHLVHVHVPHRWGHRRSEEEVRRELQGVAGRAERPVGTHLQTAANIADGLTAAIDRLGCDVVIVAAHHDLAPALLGSTDRRIVRQSDVPVLLVPKGASAARVAALSASTKTAN